MKFSLPVACVAATLAVAASVPVWAQQVDSRTFNVVGTWNFLTNWQKMEQPFWTDELPKATGGKLKGNIKSITEVNLKGTEVIRLLKQGVFDFAAALPIYVEDGGAIFLQKPFQPQELVTRLRDVLDGRNASRRRAQ